MEAVQADWAVSERRACSVLLVNRSTCQYRSRRTGQAALETRIREICETRMRYGYRRVYIQLRREGWAVNHRQVHRIYNKLGMQLRNTETEQQLIRGINCPSKGETTGQS